MLLPNVNFLFPWPKKPIAVKLGDTFGSYFYEEFNVIFIQPQIAPEDADERLAKQAQDPSNICIGSLCWQKLVNKTPANGVNLYFILTTFTHS